MSPTQCDSAESNPTQSSPLSSPPPLSFARPRFDSTPHSSSPLASNEPTTTLDLSREEDSTPCQSRRLSSASLEANRSVLGETTVGKRGGDQNEGVNEGLSDTAIGEPDIRVQNLVRSLHEAHFPFSLVHRRYSIRADRRRIRTLPISFFRPFPHDLDDRFEPSRRTSSFSFSRFRFRNRSLFSYFFIPS